MWQQIQLLCPNAQPTHMLMDFELAAIKSFQVYWPNTNAKGCFFHLTQNIWRKVQAEGLQADFNQNEEFALKIRLLPALAYASPFDVPELFADVVQQLPMPAAQGLVLYFERTYIGRTLPGGTFLDPLFPIEFWKCPKDFQKQRILLKLFQCYCRLPSSKHMEIYYRSKERTRTC